MNGLDHEAARFLERDFNQAFAEKRRLEDLSWDMLKFTFTAYATLVGISLGLYQFSVERNNELASVATGILVVGLPVGLFMLTLVVRNRVYFVVVSRYINQHRQFFLQKQPIGFVDRTGMYQDPSKPRYFSWRSSQSWSTLLLAFLNSVLIGVLAQVLADGGTRALSALAVTAWATGLVCQSALAIAYLMTREGKSADKAVFGAQSSHVTEQGDRD